MRTVVQMVVFIAVSAFIFGCNSKNSAEQKALLDNNKNLAIKFLQGVQDGDKNKMYEAANLTKEIVDESRQRLIQSGQNKLTDQQRSDFEHALRISGNIDFIGKKIKMMMPKSATFEITQTKSKELPDGVRRTDHSTKITYGNKEEAMQDKTGKTVKELMLPLLQISRTVNGRAINDFSFDNKDFEKLADKDFQVVSYY